MGIERSRERQKRDSKRRQRAASATTWGGEVQVRRVGDPEPTEQPPMPVSKRSQAS